MGCLENLKEYLENTSIHGLPDIYRERSRVLRVLWIIALLGSLALLSYSLKDVFVSYLDKSVATKVEFHTANKFPALLYCPREWINLSRLEEEPLIPTVDLRDFAIYLYSLVPFSLSIHQFDGMKMYRKPNMLAKQTQLQTVLETVLNTKLMSLIEYLEFVALDPQTLFTSANMFILMEKKKITIRREYRAIGVCYQIDAMTAIQTSLSLMQAKYSFLNITLNMPVSLSGNSAIFPDKYEGENQALFIGQDALAQAPASPYPLVPARQNVIGVHPLEMVRLKVGNLFCNGNDSYQDTDECRHNCIVEHICGATASCQMLLTRDQIVNGTCSFVTHLADHCAFSFLAGDDNRDDHCYTNCAEPCSTTVFNPITSVAETTDNRTANSDLKFLKTGLMVRFRDPQECMKYSDVFVYNAASMIANVGGMISLFCGASLLSVIQLILYTCGKWLVRTKKSDDQIVLKK